MKKRKRHRTKSTKPIHNLWKILEWEMVDQVLLIAVVWPLRKNEPDRPFDDRIDDARCYLSHLDDLLMEEEEEEEEGVECLIPIWVLSRLFVSLEWDLCPG
jgi:hypothetical protein